MLTLLEKARRAKALGRQALALIAPLLLCGHSAAKGIALIDDNGRSVNLPQAAQRVVALTPHIVENLFSAGAGKKIVGAVEYSNYPEAARSLPRVGSHNTFNLEAILALRPDLVVAWHGGNKPAQVEQLKRLGIPVYVSNPRSLEDLAQSVRTYGQLTGTQAQADKAANHYLGELQTLRLQYSGAATVTAFYQVWNQPLQTLNGKHLISDVLRLCGGHNIFTDAVSVAPKINLEAVIQRNPDAIIASGMGEARPEWLDAWHTVPDLSAVKNKHLFFVPPDLVQRHTFRILQGARMICQQLEQVREFKSR